MIIIIIIMTIAQCLRRRSVAARLVTSHHITACTYSIAKPQAKDAKPAPEIALVPPAAMLRSGHRQMPRN